MRIGDVYGSDTSCKGVINKYEVVSLPSWDSVEIIHSSGATIVVNRSVVERLTFLGNFSKSSNFSNLYDLLSEKPHSQINP